MVMAERSLLQCHPLGLDLVRTAARRSRIWRAWPAARCTRFAPAAGRRSRWRAPPSWWRIIRAPPRRKRRSAARRFWAAPAIL